MSGGGMQGQQGAPMQGGGGKGGAGGGMNRGPGGNAQNNPGGAAGQPMNPGSGAFANYGNTMQGLGPNMPGNQVNSGPTAPAGMPSWASTSGLTPIGQFSQFGQQPRPGYGGRLPAPSLQQGLLDYRNRMSYGRR